MSEICIRVGTNFYNETTEPTIEDDGTLVLAGGRKLAPGSWSITDEECS